MDESQIASPAVEAPLLEPQSIEAPGTPAPMSAEVGPAVPIGVPVIAPMIVPKPKPIIVPERVEDGWKTPSLHLKRAAGGFYLTLHATQGTSSQVIHLTSSQLERLMRLVDGDQGVLWRKLSEIPLERPMPSRALEDELRCLLRTFGPELRSNRSTS